MRLIPFSIFSITFFEGAKVIKMFLYDDFLVKKKFETLFFVGISGQSAVVFCLKLFGIIGTGGKREKCKIVDKFWSLILFCHKIMAL
jgi:hypothetical protein